MNNTSIYDKGFYNKHAEGMTKSAVRVLDSLFSIYMPNSILDVGCGRGYWLMQAKRMGIHDLCGIDGEWVTDVGLVDDSIKFIPHNLNEKIQTHRKYDLVMSLEVAEHISRNSSVDFIESLCGCTDVVLFSAAIKAQGGDNHINEQWQSYWADLFSERNYKPVDILRPMLWEDEDVMWWYRQNILLYINAMNPLYIELINSGGMQVPINLVHPMNYMHKVNLLNKVYNRPNFKDVVRVCGSYLKSILKV